jgi:hypothetical protein
VEAASDLDPELADEVISAESFAAIPAQPLKRALRRIALNPASTGNYTTFCSIQKCTNYDIFC